MTDLSPAAQAVLDAVLSTYADSVPKDERLWAIERNSVVAALRAAANTVANHDNYETVCVFEADCWDYGYLAAVDTIREKLIAIATELENH